jgi:hypothetical protein
MVLLAGWLAFGWLVGWQSASAGWLAGWLAGNAAAGACYKLALAALQTLTGNVVQWPQCRGACSHCLRRRNVAQRDMTSCRNVIYGYLPLFTVIYGYLALFIVIYRFGARCNWNNTPARPVQLAPDAPDALIACARLPARRARSIGAVGFEPLFRACSSRMDFEASRPQSSRPIRSRPLEPDGL